MSLIRPEEWLNVWRKLNRSMQSREEQAQQVVRSHVLWSLGAGVVPLPGIDVAAVTAVQLDMISQLCTVYNVEFSSAAGKSILTALVGSSMARLGASFVKAIPFIGPLVGGATMSILSGASTYAVGQVFIRHFEDNGNLQDLNIGQAQKYYEEAVERGREFVSGLGREFTNQGGAAAGPTAGTVYEAVPTNGAAPKTEDVFVRLEKLSKLREKGILTDEEFQQQKARLLELL